MPLQPLTTPFVAWARARHVGDALRLVRLLLLSFSILIATGLSGVAALRAGGSTHRVVPELVALVLPALAVRWVWEYLGLRSLALWDAVDAGLLVCVGLALASPLSIVMLLFARVAARSMSARWREVLTVCATYVTALLVAATVRQAGGTATDIPAAVFLACGLPVAGVVFNVFGGALERLSRSVAREVAVRAAIANLARARGEGVAAAAVTAARTLVRDRALGVAIALGPPTACFVAAAADERGTGAVTGRPVDLRQLSPARLDELRRGAVQLTGADLAVVWPPDRGRPPAAVLVFDIPVGGASGGLLFVYGAAVPREEQTALATLAVHVGLRLETMALGTELQQRRDDERIEMLTRHTSDVIAVLDRAGVVLYASAASATLLDRPAPELAGHPLTDVVHPDDVAAVRRKLQDAVVECDSTVFEFRVRTARGERHAEALCNCLGGDAAVTGRVVTIRDITDRRRMEEGLRESENNFRRLFEANPQPMWLYDTATHELLVVNDAAVLLYGYERDELHGMRVDDLLATPAVPVHDDKRRPHEPYEATRHVTRDGRVIDVSVETSALRFRDRDAVLMLTRDVTEERELHRRLEHQTLHDLLTGLPNRRLLQTHLRRALTRAEKLQSQPPALLVLDLDGFKNVNDTLGHALGDAVIVAVASRIERTLRPGDTACRLGGDEFAVLLEEAGSVADAVGVARRLIADIEQPIAVEGRVVRLSASVGVARPEGDSAGGDDLVGDADIAMYVAKSQGSGHCVVFDPSQRRALTDRLVMQEQLADAVRDGRLHVVYQPQVELDSGRIVAAEALARWTHPDLGVVPPDVFIPLAEQVGLVSSIDAWILRTACAQLRAWIDRGLLGLRIAVNLSGSDLERDDITDVVRAALDSAGLEPAQLEVELTESVAVGQPEAATQRLADLHDMGVRIAIDDFGTGYSMFSRLRGVAVDRLKVDRSFVADVAHDEEARAIVRSTITMGHALGLEIVAEGVEDAATATLLREMRCDVAQGYHLAAPLCADEMTDWLRERMAFAARAAG